MIPASAFDVHLQWFANPALSQMQSVGDFTLVYTHPLLNSGNPIGWVGFKVDASIVSAEQEMDNAKVVALIGGIVVVITNTVRAGRLRFAAVRTSGDLTKGDIVAACQALQQSGDNVGGTLRAAWGQNGQIVAYTFSGVTVARCQPLHIMGNDVADYDVQLVYSDWSPN